MTTTRFLLTALALATCTLSATAFPPIEEVPAHRVRLRVTTVDGEVPAETLSLTWQMGTAAEQVTTVGDQWSDWLSSSPDLVAKELDRYPNKNNRYWQMRTLVTLRGKNPGSALGLEVESAIANHEGQKTPALIWGNTVGLMLWKDDAGGLHIDTLAGHGRRVYSDALRAAVLPPEERPKQIFFGERYIGGDTDLIAWNEGVDRLVSMGFNAMHPLPEPVVETVRKGGVAKVWGAVYNPPGYAFNFAEDRPQIFADFARKMAEGAYKAGWTREDIAFWVTSDEPGWYYPAKYEEFNADPLALAAFHGYLRAQGLSPQDLGAESWEAVRFIGRNDHDDLPGRRLFYWSNRFFPWASSRFFAEVTRAYEAEMGDGIPIMVNFNNFLGRLYQAGPVGNNRDKESPNAAMGQHDWLEFGRERGSTCIATEDWFGDAQAGQWSFYAARLRAAARFHNEQFGALVIPRTSGQRPGGMPQKILSLVGNGAKSIKFFTFGPEYNFPGNCYSEVRDVFVPLSRSMQLVARSEALLFPGVAPVPRTAILTPQSSQLWDLQEQEIAKGLLDVTNTNLVRRHMPYMTETFGLYTAFQHQAIPVDMVDELGLHDGSLAVTRLLLVTAPDLPDESREGMLRWVESGGTLLLTAGAGAHDRYNQPTSQLDAILGIRKSTLDRQVYPADPKQVATSGQLMLEGKSFELRGPRESLDVTAEANVTARFEDGQPAILESAHGQGRIVRYAFYPGTSYLLSGVSEGDGALPTGFSPAVRDHLGVVAKEAAVTMPVLVDRPMIEAPVLISERGIAVTLLNWSGDDQEEVRLTVPVDRAIGEVTSAAGTAIQVDRQTDHCIVTLDLGDVDVISLHYTNREEP